MASRGGLAGLAAGLLLAGVAAWLLLRGSGAEAPTVPPAPAEPARFAAPAPDRPSRPAREALPAPGATDAPPPAADPPPSPARPPLLVLVEDASTGAPVAGATVELREEDILTRSAATDGEGRARFDGARALLATVRAVAAGRAAAWIVVPEKDEPGGTEVRVGLEPGTEISGVVRSARTGIGVAGARVEATRGGTLGDRSVFYMAPRLSTAIADAEGRFTVGGVPYGIIVTVAAGAPGFVRGERALQLGEGSADLPPVELLLDEGATAAGVVTDPEGRVVAGAAVTVVTGDGDDGGGGAPADGVIGPWGGGLTLAGTGTTDGEGRYAVEGLRLGVPCRFYATARGFARSVLSDPPRVAETPGQQLVEDLRLRRAAEIRVRVVDPDGESPSDAKVSIALTEHSFLGPSRGEDGAALFPRLPPGDWDVRASSEGLLPASATVSLAEGEVRSLRLVLERGASLSGTVVDDRGLPVPGASVWSFPHAVARGPFGDTRDPGMDGHAQADGEGRFRLEGLRPGRHRLGAHGAVHDRGEVAAAEVPGEGAEIVVPRCGAVRFRLGPPAGAEVEGAVTVSVELLPSGGGWEAGGDGAAGGLVGGIPPRPVRLVFTAEGFPPVTREVTLRPGEERDLGVLPLDPGHELVGRVVAPTGDPVGGAWVVVELPGPGKRATATTGGDGRFRMAGLPARATRVRVGGVGFAEFTTVADPAEAAGERTFVLRRAARLRGRVTWSTGDPVGDAVVVATFRGEDSSGVESPRTFRADASGAFDGEVAEGPWTLEAGSGKGGLIDRTSVTAVAGEETAVVLSMPPR